MANKSAVRPFRFSTATRTQKENAYLECLDHCIRSSPFSDVERMMNFPLYAPRQNLTNFLIKCEIFRRVLQVQGSVVECGVFFGGGLFSWAQFSAIFEPTNHQRRVIGFDTFSGFPRLARPDETATSTEAHSAGLAIDSYSHLFRCAEVHDMNRFVGHIPRIELVRGDATQTIPQYVQDNPHLLVSLLYLDFDIYEPTKVAIQNLVPRMPKGAIIAFDELNLKDWPGETAAVIEAFNLRHLRIERLPFGSTISFAHIE